MYDHILLDNVIPRNKTHQDLNIIFNEYNLLVELVKTEL